MSDAAVNPLAPLAQALIPELLNSPAADGFIERIVEKLAARLKADEARSRGANLASIRETAAKFPNWTVNKLRWRHQNPDARWRQLRVSRKSGTRVLIDADALRQYDQEGEIR